MKRHSIILGTALLVSAALLGAEDSPFAGRWDLTITSNGATYPDWMEVKDEGGSPKVRVQLRTGNVHPLEARMERSKLIVTVPAPNDAPGSVPASSWELTAEGDKITGVQKLGSADDGKVVGRRAPALNRSAPAAWGNPETLFDGKDLSGWEALNNTPAAIANPKNNWTVKNGELTNITKGANLRTTRTFNDFKLHIEFNVPPGENSGVYLRGRYETQVGVGGGPNAPASKSSTNMAPSVGSIYGFVKFPLTSPVLADTWHTYDITLIGRYVTVVLDGVKGIDNQEIPGITGGAIDSDEDKPGPIYLQGDHHGGVRYKNITIAVPKH